MLGALSLPHERRRLEPVESRHVDVEQDDGELPPQELPQGLAPGARADDVLAQLRQDHRQRQQLVRAVVDSQDADAFLAAGDHTKQPRPQDRQHLVRVHGFGEVVPGAGLERLLAVSLHRLGRDRDDRERPELLDLPDLPHRVVAVHAGHHDVHQDHVDALGLPEPLDRLLAGLRGDDDHLLPLQHAGDREDVADVVIDDQDFLAREDRVGIEPGEPVARLLGKLGDAHVQEERGLVEPAARPSGRA